MCQYARVKLSGFYCVYKFAVNCRWPSKGPFTVSVCINISITLSLDTMDFNKTIHSGRDANGTAISVMLTQTLNSMLTVNGP